MKAYFLSYAHEDGPLADAVERALKTNGVRIWRDRDHLVPGVRFADSIQRAIHEQCSGLVVLVTRKSLSSGFISNIELPEAYHSQMPIIPIFVDVAVEEVKRLASSEIGFDLTSYEGVSKLPMPRRKDRAVFEDKIRDVAFKILRTSLRRRGADGRTDPLRIALHSFQYVADQESDVDLDWTAHYAEGLPAPETWSEQLLPALECVKRAITESGLGTPDLYLPFGVHLSIGVAFGFVFCRQARFHLLFDHYGQLWTTRDAGGPQESVPPLEYDREQADVDDPRSKEIALGLSVVRDLRPSLDQIQGMRLKRNLVPPDGPARDAVSNGLYARRWAGQAVDCMDELQHAHGIETLHLYMSIPFSMSVMIGWLLNARRAVQVHEWARDLAQYQPACRLIG